MNTQQMLEMLAKSYGELEAQKHGLTIAIRGLKMVLIADDMAESVHLYGEAREMIEGMADDIIEAARDVKEYMRDIEEAGEVLLQEETSRVKKHERSRCRRSKER